MKENITFPVIDLSASELEAWKTRAGEALWDFASRNAPIRGKLTGRHLYIDSKSITNAILLEGVVPNASIWKAAKVPVDKRVPTTPHPVRVYGKWKTVKTKTKTTPTLGVPLRPVVYSKGRQIGNVGFFGLQRDGAVLYYGLTQDGRSALPAFSQSIVEWLTETQMAEVQRILDETFDSFIKEHIA